MMCALAEPDDVATVGGSVGRVLLWVICDADWTVERAHPSMALGVAISEGNNGPFSVKRAGSIPPRRVFALRNAKRRPTNAGRFDIDEEKGF
jgi:hypothetical protein